MGSHSAAAASQPTRLAFIPWIPPVIVETTIATSAAPSVNAFGMRRVRKSKEQATHVIPTAMESCRVIFIAPEEHDGEVLPSPSRFAIACHLRDRDSVQLRADFREESRNARPHGGERGDRSKRDQPCE